MLFKKGMKLSWQRKGEHSTAGREARVPGSRVQAAVTGQWPARPVGASLNAGPGSGRPAGPAHLMKPLREMISAWQSLTVSPFRLRESPFTQRFPGRALMVSGEFPQEVTMKRGEAVCS